MLFPPFVRIAIFYHILLNFPRVILDLNVFQYFKETINQIKVNSRKHAKTQKYNRNKFMRYNKIP